MLGGNEEKECTRALANIDNKNSSHSPTKELELPPNPPSSYHQNTEEVDMQPIESSPAAAGDDSGLTMRLLPKRQKLLSDASEQDNHRQTMDEESTTNSAVKKKNKEEMEQDNSSSDEDDEARPSGKLEFRIPNISRFNTKHLTVETKLLSPTPTVIRCLPWRILFLLRPASSSTTASASFNNRSVGFFLQCNSECDSPTWHCHTRAKLTIVAQRPGAESLTKHIDHTFFFKENDWGFSCFITWGDLMDPEKGYVLPPVPTIDSASSSPKAAENENSSLVKNVTHTLRSRARSRSMSDQSVGQTNKAAGQLSKESERSSSLDDRKAAVIASVRSAVSPTTPGHTDSVKSEPDTLVLQVHVYADAPHGVDWDSKRFTGFVGLRNQGATCYMNSLLQALYFTNQLRRAVFLMPTESDEASTSIPLALQRVFYELQFSERAVGTKKLTRSFGWESLDSFMQHDAQELCRVLLDNIESKMKGTSVEETIPQLFRGKMLSYIRCKHVPYESKREENFYDIQLKVKGNRDIYQAFEEYITVETMGGENKYDAGKFGLQEAEKGVIFTQFPPVLYLQLMRFQYDCLTNANVKLNDRFEFPYRLNLDRFQRIQPSANDPCTYILHAVLVHSGDNHGGHYVVYINPFGDNKWYKFDDDVVSRSTRKEAINLNYGCLDDEQSYLFKNCTSAYMLIYIRQSDLPQILRPVPVTDIPESLILRLKEERRVEADHRRAKAESHLYTCVLLVLEEDFYGWQGFDLCDLETLPTRRVNVPKTASLQELIQIVASHLHEKTNRIRLWRVQPRRSGTLRVCPIEVAHTISPQRLPMTELTEAHLAIGPKPNAGDPIAALTAFTNSCHRVINNNNSKGEIETHRKKSPSLLIDRAVPQNRTGNGDMLLPASGLLAVWVQALPPEEPIHELPPFDSHHDVLCFLKFFAPPYPPPDHVDLESHSPHFSPLLNNLGTLSYVGWISLRLSLPLRSILPELCRRALLPPDMPLLLYEEVCVGELQPVTEFDTPVRESLSDGSDALILVYQKLVEVAETPSISSPEVVVDDDMVRPPSKFSTVVQKCKSTVAQRSNSSLLLRSKRYRRRPFSKLLNSRHSLCQQARNHLNARVRRQKKGDTNFLSTAAALKRVSSQNTHQNRRQRYPTDSLLSSCQFAPHFFCELLTRVPVEFYELRFPWNLLNVSNLLAGFAIVLPLTGDKCLLPGVPLANKASFPSQCLFATITAKSPSFTVRLSFKHSFRYLLAILASYLSTKPAFIQLFKPRSLGNGGGEKEFFAIPSSFCGNLQSILSALDYQQTHRSSIPTTLFRQNQAPTQPQQPTSKNNASPVQLYYQRLSLPAGEVERLCQLRCVFVDSTRVHEVAKLILVVPRSSNVTELLEVARIELMQIGVLASSTASSASSPSTSSMENAALVAPEKNEETSQDSQNDSGVVPLRLLETLNSWIIQQYPGDQLASRLQLLDNRLLRIEVIPPEERSVCPDDGVGSCDSKSGVSPILLPPPPPTQIHTTTALNSSEFLSSTATNPLDPPVSISNLLTLQGLCPRYQSGDIDDDLEEEDDDDNDEEENDVAVEDEDDVEEDDDEDDDEEEEEEDDDEEDGYDSENLALNELSNDEDMSKVFNLLNPPDNGVGQKMLNSPETFEADRTLDSISCDGENFLTTTTTTNNSTLHTDLKSDASDDEDETEIKQSVISTSPRLAHSLVVSCGHFFRGEPSCGGFGLPFTFVLHHGEQISSLTGRLRWRLGASAHEAEKWRLACLPGPIPFGSSSLPSRQPLMPTQESLIMMRPSYLSSDPSACLNLSLFFPSSLTSASEDDATRIMLLFGLRPWLGIEHKLPPKRPRCVLSEKPIRILN